MNSQLCTIVLKRYATHLLCSLLSWTVQWYLCVRQDVRKLYSFWKLRCVCVKHKVEWSVFSVRQYFENLDVTRGQTVKIKTLLLKTKAKDNLFCRQSPSRPRPKSRWLQHCLIHFFLILMTICFRHTQYKIVPCTSTVMVHACWASTN
jgi:hypothetical protein